MRIEAEDAAAATDAILFDIGAGEEVVVLSAHLDGHDPAESAMDNASGCAVALAVARALAPHAHRFRRRLRLAFFSAEEWALTGSRAYLAGLTELERRAIRMNVNLDSVGGSPRLTALCSDNPKLAAFVTRVTRDSGLDVGIFLPLMANSDHANFAAVGIPAFRLVAGFDECASHIQYVLTAADTRDKVKSDELASASMAAARIAWEALTIEHLVI